MRLKLDRLLKFWLCQKLKKSRPSATASVKSKSYEQLSSFDTEETAQSCEDDEKTLEKARALQEAMLTIKH